MSKNISMELLCQILVAIREGKSIYRKGKSYSQPEMSKLVNEIIEKNDKYKRNGIEAMSKDYLRRMEQNRLKPEITLVYAELYYEVFELPEETREKIRNSSRIVVLDITALMSMPHILKTFGSEYYKIIICDFVMNQLEKNKSNRKNKQNSKKARKVINEMGDLGEEKIVYYPYECDENISDAEKIKKVALEASERYICEAIVISNNKSVIAHFLGMENNRIKAILLKEYVAKRQNISAENVDLLQKIRNQKESFEGQIGLPIEDINSFFIDGRTLISACIVDKLPLEDKKKKIKWLISNGANVNKNDNASDFFPPISTAVQKNDYEMVRFLLEECDANPNVGSRYPYKKESIGIQNEGNTPLMVASHDNHPEIVELLCMHKDISINQQDRNGYTALIKACMGKNDECKYILEKYGADSRIRDFNGENAKDHYIKVKDKPIDTKKEIEKIEERIKELEERLKKLKNK